MKKAGGVSIGLLRMMSLAGLLLELLAGEGVAEVQLIGGVSSRMATTSSVKMRLSPAGRGKTLAVEWWVVMSVSASWLQAMAKGALLRFNPAQ